MRKRKPDYTMHKSCSGMSISSTGSCATTALDTCKCSTEAIQRQRHLQKATGVAKQEQLESHILSWSLVCHMESKCALTYWLLHQRYPKSW